MNYEKVAIEMLKKSGKKRSWQIFEKNNLKEGFMNVEKEGEKYRCNVCGNEVEVTRAGGGELVCCDQPMEKI